ncbi:Branched-chain amino acid transport system / permease component [Thermoanaerobacter thermohydrosulfuricus]|nr:Branched-chain amino acid transport system / permease component [Thermoanaerobacter thermohydrosulfuricus]
MMENSHKIKKRSYDFKKLFAIREMSIVLIIFILAILMSIFIPDFMTASNISTTLVGLSMDGIIAVGMTMVLVLGGIDLSVGSVMALANVVAGMLISAGFNVWLSILIAIFVSLLAGGIVGIFITKIKLNPFITTLSMMSIARGVAYVLTKGSPVSLGSISKSFDAFGQGQIFGIPNPVIILFVLVIVLILV